MKTYIASPLAFMSGYIQALASAPEFNEACEEPIFTQRGLQIKEAVKIGLDASGHDSVYIERDLNIGKLTVSLKVFDNGDIRHVYSGGFRLRMHSKGSSDWRRSGEYHSAEYLFCDLPTEEGALSPLHLGQRVGREILHYLLTARMPTSIEIADTLKGISVSKPE